MCTFSDYILIKVLLFLTSVLSGSSLYLHWFYWEWFNLDASVTFFLGKSCIYVCNNMYACSHECFGRLRWRAFLYLSPSLSLTARARTNARTHHFVQKHTCTHSHSVLFCMSSAIEEVGKCLCSVRGADGTCWQRWELHSCLNKSAYTRNKNWYRKYCFDEVWIIWYMFW